MGIATAPPAPARGPVSPARGGRFLFYTNECVGLGHLRRALTLAAAVTERDAAATALVVTGAPVELEYRLPARVDTVKLPVLTRGQEGRQRARLAIDLDEARRLRGELALTAARAYRPDVAVVDKIPLGLGGELVPALEALRGSCRVVLGLRDVEDDPFAVRRRWNEQLRRAVARYYDAILVYGPRTSADALAAAGWTDLDLPVHHVGYVAAATPTAPPPDLPPGYVLATVGGGADGFDLLSAFLRAVRLRPLPCAAVVVTGPLMPDEDVHALHRLATGLDVRVFAARPDMEAVIAGARAAVAMAGYNTVLELLRGRKPTLLVPRVRPSREQLIRAQALAEAGRASLLHPAELTPARLRDALDALLATAEPPFEVPGDEDGAARAAAVLGGLAVAEATG